MNHGCLDMTANAPAAAKIAFAVVQHLEKAGVEQVLNVLNVLNTVRAARVFNTLLRSGVAHVQHLRRRWC